MAAIAPAAGTVRPQTARGLSLGYVVALAALVAIAAIYGLVADDAYRLVRPLTRATWRAQDAVTLITLPVLIAAARRAGAGSFRAHAIVVGICTWLTYSYAHLAVGAPFNTVFLVYVAVTGMAGFAMLDGLVRVDVRAVAPAFAEVPFRATMWFLLVAAVGIAGLWLSGIVPGWFGDLPRELHLAELPNPTWVFDLAWIIPLALGAAWMARRRHPATSLVAGSVLVMLFVLSLAMLAVAPFAVAAGLGDIQDVRAQLIVFSIVFTLLGGIEAWLLVTAGRHMGRVGAWRTASWWCTTERTAGSAGPT